MNNKDISAILSAGPGATTTERPGRTRVEESLAARVNVVPGPRSKVVALPVADGHHAYLSWVASSTRAP